MRVTAARNPLRASRRRRTTGGLGPAISMRSRSRISISPCTSSGVSRRCRTGRDGAGADPHTRRPIQGFSACSVSYAFGERDVGRGPCSLPIIAGSGSRRYRWTTRRSTAAATSASPQAAASSRPGARIVFGDPARLHRTMSSCRDSDRVVLHNVGSESHLLLMAVTHSTATGHTRHLRNLRQSRSAIRVGGRDTSQLLAATRASARHGREEKNRDR